MTAAVVFILPLLALLACLSLDRLVPTRWLAGGAALSLLVSGVGLLVLRASRPLPLVLVDQTWLIFDDQPVSLFLRLDGSNWFLASLILFGGALALLVLALALPRDLRGFGALFATLLASLLVVLAGVAVREPLLLPIFWMLATLAGFLSLRVSGALADSDAPLVLLVAGGGSAALVLLAALLARMSAPGEPLWPGVWVCWTLAALLALGLPPFHSTIGMLAQAPAALLAVLLPLGTPLLACYTLMQLLAVQEPLLPDVWLTIMALLSLLALFGGAAGANRATSVRSLIGWLFSAQMGLTILALVSGGALLSLVGPALIANTALAVLAMLLAVAALERRIGSDTLGASETSARLPLPGVAFLIAAAALVGAPGTWGVWTHRWLLEGFPPDLQWLVPLILAGSVPLALACVTPLALFWRGARTTPLLGSRDAPLNWSTRVALLAPLLAALPLVLLGVVPQLAWQGWLANAQLAFNPDAPEVPTLPMEGWLQVVNGLAALAVLLVPLAARRAAARPPAADEEDGLPGVMPPIAFGSSLAGLEVLARADVALRVLWQLLLSSGGLLQRALGLLERRYYLAGLLLAVIVVLLIFL